ncbi:MAG: PIN domain nuclease [Thermoleophilaceae bacterium]|nr:PIN domain nuclease [Thermoleophilaceae bacterium]
MEVVLVDTSAWIEYSKSTGSGVDLRLDALIKADAPVASTEPIAMELLAGARSDKLRRQTRKMLNRFKHIPFNSTIDFPEAARIYRDCRAAGVTPRNHVDCMIAAVALRTDSAVLTSDSEFEQISAVTGLKIQAT